MKHVFFWIAIVGIGIGLAVWTEAHQQGPIHSTSGMMTQRMTGGKVDAAQEVGNAASSYSSLCAALNPKPKDFTDCKAMAKSSDETLFKTIKGGGQSVGLSAMMPAWGGSLTDSQIHNLVEYVRRFCKK
jgi:hypothetical protein